MLQSITWQATDTLVRGQFAIFHDAGNAARLTEDERRQALCLEEPEWDAWSEFLFDGPLPAHPPVPDMLLRIGAASHGLVVGAERLGVAA
jgi:hypothetical protein